MTRKLALSDVRPRVDPDWCLERIQKSGCLAKLDRMPKGQRVIVDLDRVPSNVASAESRCDFILITDQAILAPIELKRGEIDASEAKRQLQAGADFADRRLVPKDRRSVLKPIAFVGHVDRHQRDLLKRQANAIRFRGTSAEIRIAKCQSSLADALR